MNQLVENDLNGGNEVVGESNDWGSDDLCFSSDFDIDAVQVEEGGVHYATEDSISAKYVDKQQYEKEKQTWEDAMEGLSQRFTRSQRMLENMKGIVFQCEKRIEELEEEKKEAFKYKDLYEVAQKQIADLNGILVESTQDVANIRIRLEEAEDEKHELEDKLYGPVNYYYQEYLKLQEKYQQLAEEKDALEEQLRKVKEIMRGMIVEQSHLPTADDVQRERESFAKQIAVFESRIDALEEENRRLKENQQVDNNQQDSKQTEDIPSVSDEHNQSSSVF
ncbi:hypothetical protein JH06_0545 [Blastocystis sp. subtype 4]|uniref:hypothetical protein n=1 Tax=Blastocystis sp. subtype 4 TaxID=944170 RepID=UPI0007119586|nr:hypothetical protein JH06_0545 [Blastocystis sp. subtype 4]KNB46238.1 hypothetical protein JH06_0545 [Blastocystis sp. subtype 4]|eukprot:XP_014529680.1 hypothetical protein JH06_0545 [Blastocystis sp. subtype 4]